MPLNLVPAVLRGVFDHPAWSRKAALKSWPCRCFGDGAAGARPTPAELARSVGASGPEDLNPPRPDRAGTIMKRVLPSSPPGVGCPDSQVLARQGGMQEPGNLPIALGRLFARGPLRHLPLGAIMSAT